MPLARWMDPCKEVIPTAFANPVYRRFGERYRTMIKSRKPENERWRMLRTRCLYSLQDLTVPMFHRFDIVSAQCGPRALQILQQVSDLRIPMCGGSQRVDQTGSPFGR